MKLFCKCPLPKVGSPDWPWEESTKEALAKVVIEEGATIPEDLRIESDFSNVPATTAMIRGVEHEFKAHTTCGAALSKLTRMRKVNLTTARMPGYEVQQRLAATNVREGDGVLRQGIESHVDRLECYWDNDNPENSIRYAKEGCELHARQQWVKQNLLTMQECEIGLEARK